MRAARAQEVNYDKYMMNWPIEYYRMMDPMERKKMLMYAMEQGLDPEGNKIRMELWNLRYPDADTLSAKGKTIIDRYMAAWVHLDYVNERVGSLFFGKKIIKDTKQHLDRMGVTEYEKAGGCAKENLRNELYHLACFYISFCKEDSKYNALVMGVGKLKEDAFANKIAETFYDVCYRAPKGLGMEMEFKLWQEAAHDAYEDIFPQYVYLLDERIRDGK